MNLGREFWDQRWVNSETNWDLGCPSPPIIDFLDTIVDLPERILIPGCGQAHETQYLIDRGAKNVTLIDISPKACAILEDRFADEPNVSICCEDFFEHQGRYDLILEQTFFCALDPELRRDYVTKMHQLLNSNGLLAGVLFGTTFEKKGPPFGGTLDEYKDLFAPSFVLERLLPCANSVKPRLGNELWITFRKK